jgi:transcriptional regulator with PAS, ATPase and Fis domain
MSPRRSTKNKGFGMKQDVESADVTFAEVPMTGSGTGTGSFAIATFGPTAAGGRAGRALRRNATGRLIGESPAMLEVAERLRRIAPSLSAVMLVGESGTGKEVAAQMLHTRSSRSRGPFVSVNCGAIPSNLVEAELFGYERGAFTGALRQHQGYFERASGGTLFLDEITEMPIDLQAKLLRVLESGRMTRIGGTVEIAVDVRVVTATNRATDAIVRDRRLREDLFYRLAVFLIQLPPLRQRGGDIELLAATFLAQLNDENGTMKHFELASLADARTHPWPGNVRELKNCVERSYVLSDTVVKLDLQPAFDRRAADLHDGDCVQLPIGMTMADAERELLLATLRHCGGNKRRTAEVLGVSLKTVYNKLVGYGTGTPALAANR